MAKTKGWAKAPNVFFIGAMRTTDERNAEVESEQAAWVAIRQEFHTTFRAVDDAYQQSMASLQTKTVADKDSERDLYGQVLEQVSKWADIVEANEKAFAIDAQTNRIVSVAAKAKKVGGLYLALGGEAFVQNFRLQKGWNWVSFNLKSDQLNDVNELLVSMKWNDGDILTDMGSDMTLVYKNGQWLSTESMQNITLSPKKSYAVKVKEPNTFYVGGTVIKEKDDRTITLAKGWNAIGYTPMTNLTVEIALSDYYDHAEQGDVVKSHTEFAYFTKQGNTGRWRGSLKYMKPGEGYMMLRKGATRASFAYPFYELESTFNVHRAPARRAAATETQNPAKLWRNTMIVMAIVEGFELEEGDRLVAYTDGELVGNEELNNRRLSKGRSLTTETNGYYFSGESCSVSGKSCIFAASIRKQRRLWKQQ